MFLGTRAKLSVVMTKQSLSKDRTLLNGECSSIRPKEADMTASSSRDQTCGDRSTRSSHILYPMPCSVDLTAGTKGRIRSLAERGVV
jgi:hypothetical protein